MDLSANVHPELVVSVVRWAARHSLSVGAVVEQALAEYMLDVDSGLVCPPPPKPRALMRPFPRYMREP